MFSCLQTRPWVTHIKCLKQIEGDHDTPPPNGDSSFLLYINLIQVTLSSTYFSFLPFNNFLLKEKRTLCNDLKETCIGYASILLKCFSREKIACI